MGSFLSSPNTENEWRNDAQFAMDSGCFCVICGGPFDLEGNAHYIDSKEKRYRWLSKFRITGNALGLANHNMTGEAAEPANTSKDEDVFLSEQAQYTVTGSGYFSVGSNLNGTDVWFDPLRAGADGNTVIALHEACISIGCKVIASYQAKHPKREQLSPLGVLNYLLQDRYRKAENTVQGSQNDLFDLCTFSETYGPRSVIGLSRVDWWGGEHERFLIDPMKIPDLASFALAILQATPHRKEDYAQALQPTREARGLELLPTEIFDQICTYLPASSAIRLHRVSKTLALKTPLDNSFWRKSLLDGSLLPHIWDLEKKELGKPALEATCDWKSVAKVLSTKRFPLSGRDPRLISIPKGFWNRCRIWSIMEEAVHLHLLIDYTDRCDSAAISHSRSENEINNSENPKHGWSGTKTALSVSTKHAPQTI